MNVPERGIDAPSEPPEDPEIVVHTHKQSPQESVGQILDELLPAPAVEVIGAEPQMDVVKQIAATLNGADLMTSLLFTTLPGHCRP